MESSNRIDTAYQVPVSSLKHNPRVSDSMVLWISTQGTEWWFLELWIRKGDLMQNVVVMKGRYMNSSVTQCVQSLLYPVVGAGHSR